MSTLVFDTGFPRRWGKLAAAFRLGVVLTSLFTPYSQPASSQALKQEDPMERSVITLRVSAQERQLFQALLRAEDTTVQEYLAAAVREKIHAAPEALKALVRGSAGSNDT